MDRLNATQKSEVKKLTTSRLRANLVDSGVEEETVAQMDRTSLVNAWAEIVAAGGEGTSTSATITTPVGAVYDPEVEKQRIALEMEIKLRELALKEKEFEERRRKEDLERELKEKEFEEKKRMEELERELRLRELALKERELEERRVVKERELALQMERENANKSVVHRAKLFGDAMKNTIARMPMDVVELGSYFKDVEQLFTNFEVPEDLRAQLLRPHLNEKAKTLVARMDPAQSTDYKAVKEMLLREFKLSPAVYLEKFNSEPRKPDETFVLYSARLKSLLEYYCESRKVEESYCKLVELLVCDRVKAGLPDGCLRHILAVESNQPDGWLKTHELANAIDLYFANRWRDGDRPRAGAVGVPSTIRPMNSHSSGFSRTTTNVPVRSVGNPANNNNNNSHTKPASDVSKTAMATDNKRTCYNCGSKFHLARDCPDRDKAMNDGSKPAQRPNAKAYTCVVRRGNTARAGGDTSQPASNNKVKRGAVVDVSVQASSADNPAPPSEGALTSGGECTSVSLTRSDNLNNDFAKLHYIDVRIADDPHSSYKVMSALCDSGAEISVVRADKVRGLNLPRVMDIKLRGIVGSPVSAEVVKLFVSCHDENSSPDDFISIVCAVCAEANDDLILTAEDVASLSQRRARIINANIVNDDSGDSDDSSDEADADGSSQPDRRTVAAETTRDNNQGQATHTEFTAENAAPVNEAESRRANSEAMRQEQADDETLKGWFSLAKRGKGNFVIHDGILYRNEKILGQNFMQLCLPKGRRTEVLTMAHDTFGGHLGAKKTQERIRLSFAWPTLASDVKKYCESCEACQKRARTSCWDRVPITPVPRAEAPFTHWFMDCLGPIFNHKVDYNYCLVLVDSATRWPAAFPLRTLTAKHVCEALLKLWMVTGIPMAISSDNATNFTSKLNRELLKRVGCSPRFNTPGHPQSSGLVERMVGTIKNMIHKVAYDHPKRWHQYLDFILWALREVPNETTGVPPWVLAFGHLPRGPLAVLKEAWCGEVDLPLDLGKGASEFLNELREKMKVAQSYAQYHTARAQSRYATRYNLRSKDKHFDVGEQVLVLSPNSTASSVFSRWKGPATVVEVKSPYSYIVEYNGGKQHVHANKLRKFNVRVDEVICDSILVEDLTVSENISVDTCAIVYENDADFGPIEVIETSITDSMNGDELPPSKRIDSGKLSHLSKRQQQELLALLDKYSECFSETPGFCNLVEHEINVTQDFKPKRLRAYKVPEKLKAEVDRQIQELLRLGFIRPSKSEMASPLVCIKKGKDGQDGVRLAVDYRYVNKYTIGDAFPMPEIAEVIQRVGRAKFISTFDAKSGYWQTPVRKDHQWLTAFVYDGGLFEWVRTPFGMKASGSTFVRVIQQILQPLKGFADSYADDMSVFSDNWVLHLQHLEKYLQTIREAGLTLNLKKCNFGKGEVKFCGHLIGSGTRRADPDKVASVQFLKVPETKTQVRQILGFFSWFRDYIPNFAAHAKPLSDLTAKRIPSKIPWGETQQKAFDKLKTLLCQATEKPLNIVDFSKSFNLFVDASDYAIAGILTQTDDHGNEKPIAFASRKLTDTQKAWATVEKEAYAALWSLQKYRNWVFGAAITVHSDHNPLTYLTDSAPKSAKLMRWALALQEFNVTFKYKPGKTNVAADCLSRLGPDGYEDPGQRE
jgi:transposase InsO family protein